MPNRIACSLFAVLLTGCATEKPAAVKEPPPKTPPPAHYRVQFETTRGTFLVEVNRDWAPRGADHFFELVRSNFYDGARFFRAIRRFIVQFGINGSPKIQQLWASLRIPDDPPSKEKNRRGWISYAKTGPNTRTTQVFINLVDNPNLDQTGFVPFARVIEGMDVVDRLYASYGEVAPRGTGPDPTRIELEGNAYLEHAFPRLDSIVRATIVQ